MADHAKSKAPQQKEAGEEESLTTLLDEEERGELTLLMASAMTTMRRTIDAAFDPDAGISQEVASDIQLEKEQDAAKNDKSAKTDVSSAEAEKKVRDRRRKELSAPEIVELKEAALTFFDEWRSKVISRVGEVVNSREQANKDARKAHSHKEPVPTGQDTKVDAGQSRKDDTAQAQFKKLYPPISTPLSSLDEKSRILVIHSTLLLLISLEHYIAPSRVLLLYLTSSLNLPLHTFIEDEEKVARGLLEAAKQMSGDAEAQKKIDENKTSRKWKVGIAGVAGAALIGVTGGLAAPLVAAGVGSVMGGLGLGATAAAGYLGTVAGSTVIVGGLFGAYGGRMTGQMMDNYAREVEDFSFVPVRKNGNIAPAAEKHSSGRHIPFHRKTDSSDEKAGQSDSESRRLRVTIGITGWLTDPAQVSSPWRVISPSTSEPFALRWEVEALLKLGNSLDAMVSSAAWGYAKSELISRTVFAGVANAVAWPMAILSIGKVVDNPFSIARSRADKAGEVLADALINKAQGERPVALIGYSLGARVIFACLRSLAQRKAFGLIETAVLIGAPCSSSTADWRLLRTVVSGRLVNVYSENDYVLRFLYRTSSMQFGVAGLSKIVGLPSIENVDVSETVNGHLRYRHLVGSILSKLGYDDLDMAEVHKEEEAFQNLLEEEKKQTYTDTAKEKSQKVLEDNPLGYGKQQNATTDTSSKSGKSDQQSQKEKEAAEIEAAKLEAEVELKTQKSLMTSISGSLPTRLKPSSGPRSGNSAATDPSGSNQAGAPAPAKGAQGSGKKEDQGLFGSISSNVGGFLSGK